MGKLAKIGKWGGHRITVCGIPCQADVTYFEGYTPAKLTGHPDTWHDAEGGYVEFELYDRKGYRAEWLEAKMHKAGKYDDVEQQVYEAHCESLREY